MTRLSAFVLISTASGKQQSAYDQVVQLPQTEFAYRVTGPFDIIAKIQADTFGQLVKDTVVDRIQSIGGITQTNTCLILSPKGDASHSEQD